MKQLVCEMCGSTDLLKEEGVFVCQSCGCKYSVEEAKKMMVEVEGAVTVQNAAQLDNLLKLAHSSFESKNYEKAEDFCNQVLAMDDKNFDAWKLKGEAINYQINSNNQRIEEVYNCIMTAYRVLDEEKKEQEKYDIFMLLNMCLKGEVYFWLQQFEANRPTDYALKRAKNAYVDSYNKMKAALEELGFLEEPKQGLLFAFDNYFIGKCNKFCLSTWKSTVAYNYYRNYIGKGVDPFSSLPKIRYHADEYRPTKAIWDTFIKEADNVIDLLKFAEKQINDNTNPEVVEAIFSNIVSFQECVIPACSWNVVWMNYVGSYMWDREWHLTDKAKENRRNTINSYLEKKHRIPERLRKIQAAQKEKKRQEKIEKYWQEHQEEKRALDDEQEDIRKKLEELKEKITAIDNANADKLEELYSEKNRLLPCEEAVRKQEDVIRALEKKRQKCGLFQGKMKQEIVTQIDQQEEPKLKELKIQAAAEKKEHQERIDVEINVLKRDGKEFRDQFAKLKKREQEITQELTKER